MINPGAIPQIPGDMDALRAHASAVTGVGTAFPDTGRRVNATWQGLSAVYSAPEAGDLLVATAPVQTVSASVGEDLTAVGSALSTYATEVAAIQTRLETLRTQAAAFVQSVAGDPDWHKSQSKVDEHNGLIKSVDAAVADFMDAQRRCANTILGLYSGKRWTVENGDGTVSDTEFGYTAAQLDGAMGEKDALPWGTGEEHDRGFLGDVGSFFSGMWDGAKGFVGGLGALIGYSDGHWTWGTAGNAWKGLGTFALALGIYSTPGGVLLDQTIGVPGFDKGQLGDTLLGAGKALIAYDEWGKDKSHAAGMATFNVLSAIIGTKGAGAGLRAGGAALEASDIVGIARVGTAAVRAGEFVGNLPTVTDVVGSTLRRFPGLRIPHIDVPGVDVPTVHVDVPHTPHLDAPHPTLHDPSVGDALPHTPHIDTPGGPVHVDTPGTPAHVDTPGAPAHVDTPSAPAHVDAGAAHPHGELGGTPHVEPTTPHTDGGAPHGAPTGTPHADGGAPHGAPTGTPHVEPSDPTHVGADGGPLDSSSAHPHGGPTGEHVAPATGHDGALPGDHPSANGPSPHPAAAELPPGLHPSDLGTRPDGSWVGAEHGVRLDLDPHANAAADGVLHHAAAAEPHITPEIRAVVEHEPGAHMVGEEFARKGEDSLKRKIATELQRNPDLSPSEAAATVRDGVRYTMELPDTSYVDGVQRAVAQMQERGFVNLDFKPSWDDPGGYKGVNTNWLDPRTGQVFELQFHTADSFAAKMQTHTFYEGMRVPGISPAEVDRLAGEQAQIFERVPVPTGTDRLLDLRETLAHTRAADIAPVSAAADHLAPHDVGPPGHTGSADGLPDAAGHPPYTDHGAGPTQPDHHVNTATGGDHAAPPHPADAHPSVGDTAPPHPDAHPSVGDAAPQHPDAHPADTHPADTHPAAAHPADAHHGVGDQAASGGEPGHPHAAPASHPAGLLDPPTAADHTPLVDHNGVLPPSVDGQALGVLPEARITRAPDGLIDTVDGRPVEHYLHEVGERRGDQIRALWSDGEITKRRTGNASAVVLDRHTGELFEASNGVRDAVIPDSQLHPLLAERLREMESAPGYPAVNGDGSLDAGGRLHPHPDEPLGHAEVKAINELLWRYGPDADPSVLRDAAVDTFTPFGRDGVRQLPFCANCAMLLHDVPSIAGRFSGFPPGPHNFLPR